MGPDPAVAAVRLAVRRALPVLTDDDGVRWIPDVRRPGAVLVACSGGADSLALLAATVFEVRKVDGVRVVGAVVDHALQEGSAEHTARVVAQMAQLGADETASIRVSVDPGPGGVEAGAREARYAALSRMAQHFGADRVLLGHTLDDQAETVLLGLTQGSGPRSLQGMRAEIKELGGPLVQRPMLGLTRAQTEAACRAEQIAWWEDPQNRDQRFLRARVRHVVMPLLEAELGPGVAAALARTGPMVRDDLAALDAIAEDELGRLDLATGVDLEHLEHLEHVVLTRVLRLAALAAGCPPRELTHGHVTALVEMVWRRRGEARDLDLPGHVRAVRRDDVLRIEGRQAPGDRGPDRGRGRPDDTGTHVAG
ncbi:tRNA lysidine(34) synthetase TilS [Nocardioides sp. HDW12B]|uniref:tRNA lysidine(34) synthetase TilS n=1 Tax=Nocardioides sp. HDW12B TaxID=2714939 RepID=UPI00140C2065|nr:tRNA lysidine(34) synthetase TilS [Nocardioides sp. HDW12B]QIK65072.1 tRNA lysidine(34) synthetase TilS [Nocardioides sp. HDW12B]